VPAAQFEQLNPVVEYWPATQLIQSAKESDPVLETDLPAAQVVQSVDPVAAAAYLPKAQSVQPAEREEPVADKYFPVGQEVQEVCPAEIT